MRDEDARILADGTTARKVTLRSGVVLDGTVSRTDHGIYNVTQLPDIAGQVTRGQVEGIRVEDIASIT